MLRFVVPLSFTEVSNYSTPVLTEPNSPSSEKKSLLVPEDDGK
jgi:hypothetical protein